MTTSPWVIVPAGRFWRGSASPLASFDEKPEGWVHVSEFWLGRWPVTIGEYRVFADLPSAWNQQVSRPANCPVVGVSWQEAQAYCQWYTEKHGDQLPDGWVVRLPTEAEWEKAARGGEVLADGQANPDPKREYVWPGRWNSTGVARDTMPVGSYPASHGPYGAWDQIGNVWEWCLDWYDLQAYSSEQQTDPVVSERPRQIDPSRVVRGGGWFFDARGLRVSCRYGFVPGYRNADLGFRCCASALAFGELDAD